MFAPLSGSSFTRSRSRILERHTANESEVVGEERTFTVLPTCANAASGAHGTLSLSTCFRHAAGQLISVE